MGGAEGPQTVTAEWGQGFPLGNKIVWNKTVVGVTQHHECVTGHRTVHSKTVKIVDFSM